MQDIDSLIHFWAWHRLLLNWTEKSIHRHSWIKSYYDFIHWIMQQYLIHFQQTSLSVGNFTM